MIDIGMFSMAKAPGKAHSDSIALIELHDMFPNEESAARWFEDVCWTTDEDRKCPHFGSFYTARKVIPKPMAFKCRDCRQLFSLLQESVLEHSRIRHRKWAIAIDLNATSLKGVSSMKLHRNHKITRKFAWFMAHRLREAFGGKDGLFAGPVEADESYLGEKRKSMSLYKRKELKNSRRWAVGKKTVAGVKDRDTKKVRATVDTATDAPRVAGFVAAQTKVGATVTTEEAKGYNTLVPFFDHERVNHSVPEYVHDMARANGNESFWTMLKRCYQGAFNHVSPQNPHRFVSEIIGRHNTRNADTIKQMKDKVAGIIGKRLVDKDLGGEKA